MKDSSHKRHIAKAATWRIIGTLDTMLISWLITGDAWVGVQIGMAEVFTKMLLYYLHERLWFKFNLEEKESRWRHLLKTLSWRIVGTVDTILLAWFISGSPVIGLKVGLVEVTTKMILYYLHERAWYRLDFGLKARRKNLKQNFNE